MHNIIIVKIPWFNQVRHKIYHEIIFKRMMFSSNLIYVIIVTVCFYSQIITSHLSTIEREKVLGPKIPYRVDRRVSNLKVHSILTNVTWMEVIIEYCRRNPKTIPGQVTVWFSGETIEKFDIFTNPQN